MTMVFIHHRITIVHVRKPKILNVNEELQWLGTSLGLFNVRDRNSSCFRLFLELLKSSKKRELLSSDELADRVELSRGTVMHHLNKLMEAGIVVSEGKRYILREDHLEALIEEIRRDLVRACENMVDAAKKIDEILMV